MIRAAAGVARLAARIPAWLAHPARSPAARVHERRALADLARSLGVTIEVAGTPCTGATLFVANHISWCDIAVLGGQVDVDFVARDDLIGWPLLGSLVGRGAPGLGGGPPPPAPRPPPVLVARSRRLASVTQAEAVRERLRAGRAVVLFAEGTTSDGADVLPFRSSLLAAADEALAVQPVVLRYLASSGAPLPSPRMREIAWIGDDAFLSNLCALVREPVIARVEFLTPIVGHTDRKALAASARTAIRTAYAAAPNRSRYRAEIASTGTTRNTSTVLNW